MANETIEILNHNMTSQEMKHDRIDAAQSVLACFSPKM